MKTAELPAVMSTGVWLVEVTALAPPVVVTVGGSGTTCCAVAPPLFTTCMVAVKVCPRDSDVGTENEVMVSPDGATTLATLEGVVGAFTVPPVVASTPEAPVEKAMVPVPVTV